MSEFATPDTHTGLRRPRTFLPSAIALWILPMLVIGIMVALDPSKRTVTPLYHEASANWWAEKNLYEGPSGMNYLPHFAVLFTPFEKLPAPTGDILWRLGSAALLATGLWRLTRLLAREETSRAFFMATSLTLPLCLGALRNGQANAIFGALTLHAAACLPHGQWWRAAALLVLALAVKPLGIVLLLLAPVVYAPLRWRGAIALLALAVFPFLFANPEYVIGQHRALLTNLQACAAVTQHRFADISGVLRTFGVEPPVAFSKALRVIAGGLTLGLWWLGARRLTEPLRALWLYALATTYLMLFNPMNEANSYVIVAPAFGLWAIHAWRETGTRNLGWIIAAMSVSMSALPNLVRPLFGNQFALFWHPVMTVVFIGVLISVIWRRDELITVPSAANQDTQ